MTLEMLDKFIKTIPPHIMRKGKHDYHSFYVAEIIQGSFFWKGLYDVTDYEENLALTVTLFYDKESITDWSCTCHDDKSFCRHIAAVALTARDLVKPVKKGKGVISYFDNRDKDANVIFANSTKEELELFLHKQITMFPELHTNLVLHFLDKFDEKVNKTYLRIVKEIFIQNPSKDTLYSNLDKLLEEILRIFNKGDFRKAWLLCKYLSEEIYQHLQSLKSAYEYSYEYEEYGWIDNSAYDKTEAYMLSKYVPILRNLLYDIAKSASDIEKHDIFLWATNLLSNEQFILEKVEDLLKLTEMVILSQHQEDKFFGIMEKLIRKADPELVSSIVHFQVTYLINQNKHERADKLMEKYQKHFKPVKSSKKKKNVHKSENPEGCF